MMKVLAGLFVGVFVGAVTYEIIRKGEITRRVARKVSDGAQAARRAFSEGYHSVGSASEPTVANA